MNPDQKALLVRGSRKVKEGAAPLAAPLVKPLPPTSLAPLDSISLAQPPAPEETFTHLTERQFEWLSFRLGTDTDADACEAVTLDPLEVSAWRGDPAFEAVYQRALENKREAFRVLGTHMLPKALRVINKLLDLPSVKANQIGLQLLLKTQALLDQPQHDQADRIVQLLDVLRTPGRVVMSETQPRD